MTTFTFCQARTLFQNKFTEGAAIRTTGIMLEKSSTLPRAACTICQSILKTPTCNLVASIKMAAMTALIGHNKLSRECTSCNLMTVLFDSDNARPFLHSSPQGTPCSSRILHTSSSLSLTSLEPCMCACPGGGMATHRAADKIIFGSTAKKSSLIALCVNKNQDCHSS